MGHFNVTMRLPPQLVVPNGIYWLNACLESLVSGLRCIEKSTSEEEQMLQLLGLAQEGWKQITAAQASFDWKRDSRKRLYTDENERCTPQAFRATR